MKATFCHGNTKNYCKLLFQNSDLFLAMFFLQLQYLNVTYHSKKKSQNCEKYKVTITVYIYIYIYICIYSVAETKNIYNRIARCNLRVKKIRIVRCKLGISRKSQNSEFISCKYEFRFYIFSTFTFFIPCWKRTSIERLCVTLETCQVSLPLCQFL